MLDCISCATACCDMYNGMPQVALGFAGVEDDGYPRGLTQTDMDTSLATLRAMAEEVHAATIMLRKAAGTRKRQCAIVRVHKLCVDDVTYTDLRIAGMHHSYCDSCSHFIMLQLDQWRDSSGSHSC